MAIEKQVQTLISKRTHSGDPNPSTGVFGNNDGMKTVRGWSIDAVIGVGGVGREPVRNGIARKLTWVGIGPHKTGDLRCPLVTFDHFLYYGESGPLLEDLAPELAKRIYGRNIRVIRDVLSTEERREVAKILELARSAPHSPGQCHGTLRQDATKTSGTSGINSCRGKSVACRAEQENSIHTKERCG